MTSLLWAKVKMDIADNNSKESSRELESTAELKIYGTGNSEIKMDKPILGQNHYRRKVYFSTNLTNTYLRQNAPKMSKIPQY